MKRGMKRYLPWGIAIAVFVVMVNLYPPGARGFTWSQWWHEDSAWLVKMSFLVRTYLRPAALAFVWIAGLQLQMRLRTNAVIAFAIVYVSAASMMTAWRTLAMGPSVLPAYALGMAIAQTMASRVYAVTKPERSLFGRRFRIYKIVWVGDSAGVARVRAQLQR